MSAPLSSDSDGSPTNLDGDPEPSQEDVKPNISTGKTATASSTKVGFFPFPTC